MLAMVGSAIHARRRSIDASWSALIAAYDFSRPGSPGAGAAGAAAKASRERRRAAEDEVSVEAHRASVPE